jgi:hypothetical protein
MCSRGKHSRGQGGLVLARAAQPGLKATLHKAGVGSQGVCCNMLPVAGRVLMPVMALKFSQLHNGFLAEAARCALVTTGV